MLDTILNLTYTLTDETQEIAGRGSSARLKPYTLTQMQSARETFETLLTALRDAQYVQSRDLRYDPYS